MVSQRWFVMVIVLMVGVISGCNVFWEGASASSQIIQPDAPDEGDTSFDDDVIREDAPDVLTGDVTPPVDRQLAEEVGDASLEDVPTLQDRVMTDAVQDEGLVPVDLPAAEDVADVTDAGGALDTGVDVFASQDVLMPMDTSSEDVQMVADVVAPPDVGQDATSVATDGGDAGSPDAGLDAGPICPSGQMLCGGACVNTAMSVDHCGACGMSCSAPVFPNMVRACQSGQCGAVCAASFANCDGLMGNGCEVDTRATAQHCGACGRACSLPNATPTCLGGSCYIMSCAAGFANCDNSEANGCEADTRSDVQHCGACGRSCSSTQRCLRGVCSDLAIEYLASSSGTSVPTGGRPGSAYVAFSGDGYTSPSDCAGGFVNLEGYRYRCVVAAPLAPIHAGSERLLLGIPGGCGLDAQVATCPAWWPSTWSVYWYGQTYEASTQVRRRVSGVMGPAIEFIDRVTCRDFGFRQGCVAFYPPAPQPSVR